MDRDIIEIDRRDYAGNFFWLKSNKKEEKVGYMEGNKERKEFLSPFRCYNEYFILDIL